MTEYYNIDTVTRETLKELVSIFKDHQSFTNQQKMIFVNTLSDLNNKECYLPLISRSLLQLSNLLGNIPEQSLWLLTKYKEYQYIINDVELPNEGK